MRLWTTQLSPGSGNQERTKVHPRQMLTLGLRHQKIRDPRDHTFSDLYTVVEKLRPNESRELPPDLGGFLRWGEAEVSQIERPTWSNEDRLIISPIHLFNSLLLQSSETYTFMISSVLCRGWQGYFVKLLGKFSALIAFLFLSSPIYVPFLPQIHLIQQRFMRLMFDATQRVHLGSFCISPGLWSLYRSLSSKRT